MMTRRGTRGGPRAGPVADPARPRHIPVLLRRVLEHLAPHDGATYIDATFGAGGYTRAILDDAACRVVAVDRDPAAVTGGADLAAAYSDRLLVLEGRFSALDTLTAAAQLGTVDGVVFDLGVSSMQLDQAERGFSFQSEGPLDMRMSGSGSSAADLIATLKETDLADLIFGLGEERRSRAIARAIVRRRDEQPIETTRELADIVSRVIGRRAPDDKHPATRTFQALRLAVNDELAEVTAGLAAAERLLKPGGRLVVVSFHSLEDRIVKRFLTERSGRAARNSRHAPDLGSTREASFRILNHKPVTPDSDEVDENPRARSAKLRAAERTEARAWPAEVAQT